MLGPILLGIEDEMKETKDAMTCSIDSPPPPSTFCHHFETLQPVNKAIVINNNIDNENTTVLGSLIPSTVVIQEKSSHMTYELCTFTRGGESVPHAKITTGAVEQTKMQPFQLENKLYLLNAAHYNEPKNFGPRFFPVLDNLHNVATTSAGDQQESVVHGISNNHCNEEPLSPSTNNVHDHDNLVADGFATDLHSSSLCQPFKHPCVATSGKRVDAHLGSSSSNHSSITIAGEEANKRTIASTKQLANDELSRYCLNDYDDLNKFQEPKHSFFVTQQQQILDISSVSRNEMKHGPSSAFAAVQWTDNASTSYHPCCKTKHRQDTTQETHQSLRPPPRHDSRDRQILPLSTKGDKKWLSDFQCFLRSHCMEVFSASAEDVASRMNSKRVALNQVGIRCRFCAHLPYRERANRSSSFPSSTNGLYHCATMMARDHFANCKAMPPSILHQYLQLKTQFNYSEHDSKTYWMRSARNDLGLIDTGQGIRFST